jgi:hypothetical protein
MLAGSSPGAAPSRSASAFNVLLLSVPPGLRRDRAPMGGMLRAHRREAEPSARPQGLTRHLRLSIHDSVAVQSLVCRMHECSASAMGLCFRLVCISRVGAWKTTLSRSPVLLTGGRVPFAGVSVLYACSHMHCCPLGLLVSCQPR